MAPKAKKSSGTRRRPQPRSLGAKAAPPKTPPKEKAPRAEVKVTVEPPEASAVLDAHHALEKLREEEHDRREAEHAQMVDFCAADLQRRRRKAHVPLDDLIMPGYLAALAATGNYIAAADAVGISDSTARNHRNPKHPTYDEEFAYACEEMLERHRKKLIAEAERRAIHGVDEPVYQQGSFVGVKRVYSDRMLEILLRAKGGPEFKDKVQVEQSGHVSTTNLNVAASAEKLASLDAEGRAALRRVLGVPIGTSVLPNESSRDPMDGDKGGEGN